jgi:hypothetical protein
LFLPWVNSGSRPLPTKEANKILTTLTAIFKLAQRYGPLQQKANVAERLKVSNEENEGSGLLGSGAQKAHRGDGAGELRTLPTLTGMRIGEVLGLTRKPEALWCSPFNELDISGNLFVNQTQFFGAKWLMAVNA